MLTKIVNFEIVSMGVKISYYLLRPTAVKSSIMMNVSYRGNNIKVATGQLCEPQNWLPGRKENPEGVQEPRGKGGISGKRYKGKYEVSKKQPGYKEINQKLVDLKQLIEN
ncbi:MAG: hypothetical protein WCT77_05245, partial [Bacteroidota bacterium]